MTVGASGVIFGWLAYLVAQGRFHQEHRPDRRWAWCWWPSGAACSGPASSRWRLADITGVVTISWQAHLFGAIGGVGGRLPRSPRQTGGGQRRTQNRLSLKALSPRSTRPSSRIGTQGERNRAPIGIFDSGVGGLTVARAIIDQLPGERIRYVGDTANSPYGPLPIDEVLGHSMAVAGHLVDSGVKLLVIACNTASASGAFEAASRRFDLPVVEVIRPAVRRAVAATRTGQIGVIGTSATIASGAYQDAFAAVSDVVVHAAACPSFVDFVERGTTSGRQVLGLAQAYLAPLQRTAVDTLVLGCTHYPLLTGVLQLVMGQSVTLVSSAEETAKDVYRLLTEADLLTDQDPVGLRAPHEFSATGDPVAFARLGRRFLGPELTSVQPALVGR